MDGENSITIFTGSVISFLSAFFVTVYIFIYHCNVIDTHIGKMVNDVNNYPSLRPMLEEILEDEHVSRYEYILFKKAVHKKNTKELLEEFNKDVE